ncbi:hypothetical protein QQX98_004542 [Neonectria punicea]|uniref:N-acetyltransferase domain-containing protein n=1 Tax=Neonectria punicea TaxID=979145 RepID=A0ABR1H962_9HYPO
MADLLPTRVGDATISRAKPEDIPAIKVIVDEAYSKYIERIGKPPAPMTTNYNELLNTHDIFVLRRDATNTIVGSIILGIDGESDSIKINNLVVDPAAQGRGYGRVLMNYAEELARSQGRPTLTLFTNVKIPSPQLSISLSGRIAQTTLSKSYAYSLSTLSSQIQLSGELISCTLRTCSIFIAQQTGYFALSYVWGDASDTRSILVNGLTFAATRNLVDALIHVCAAQPACRAGLWVDAVCINHMDIPERNVQVAMMSKIYTSATETLAWLGASDALSKAAIRLVNQLWSDDEIMGVGREPKLEKMAGLELIPILEELKDETSPIGVEVFNRRPYWDRIWTLQEAVLAKSCRLIVGTETCFLQALMNIMQWSSTAPLDQFVARDMRAEFPDDIATTMQRIQGMIRNIQNDAETSRPITKLWQTRNTALRIGVRRKFSDAVRTLDCLGNASSRKATDPRDKLFGLAALVNIGVDINYNMSTKDLYVVFSKWVIETLGLGDSLTVHRLLMSAGLASQSSALGLPSWVPDWGIRPVAIPSYSRELRIPDVPSLRPVVLGDALQAKGVLPGTVESTSSPCLIPGLRENMSVE